MRIHECMTAASTRMFAYRFFHGRKTLARIACRLIPTAREEHPMGRKADSDQVHELLLQALETERGGIQIYTEAIAAAVNDDLRKEWQEYLEQTRTHEQVLASVFEALGMDTEEQSPGRKIVAHLGQSLVSAIRMARKDAGPAAEVLQQAYDAVEQDEDHHLFHTMGWCRECWIQALGMPAVLPPPEEVKDVETAIGAARAEKA